MELCIMKRNTTRKTRARTGRKTSPGMLAAMLSLAMTILPAAASAAALQVARPAYVLQADVQGDGPVVVVFESGFGQGGGVWKDVISDLGEQCRCITYARAGLGKSGTDGKPKTIEESVQDLGAVIDALAPGTKVLLVGHSYGGLLATEYSRLHPERLRGLVLVDPATMAQRHDTLQADRARVLADDKAMLAMLPPNLAADYRMLVSELDSDAALAPRTQPDLPVALLTSTNVAAEPFVFEETAAGKALWKRQHGALFAGYTRGRHEYFATGHNIHREQPKAVADAVRFVAGFGAGEAE
jgi:pimeloyl-ACP methyl ester carboxylesterase